MTALTAALHLPPTDYAFLLVLAAALVAGYAVHRREHRRHLGAAMRHRPMTTQRVATRLRVEGGK